ncbi:MAG: prolipoprotein diacylglyceryl transferase [Bacillota bacterium]
MDHMSIEALPNALQLGPITIPLYGLMIMTGVLFALLMGIMEGKKIGIKSNDIIDGLLIILPIAILGARLWYVIFEWSSFSDYLPSIIGFNRDGSFSGFQGLAIHGGFFAALIAAYIYTKKRKMDIFKTLDLVAPGFLIGQTFGRWGNFFNQEAHGGVIGGTTNGTVNLGWDAQRSFLTNTLNLPKFITDNMFINGPDGYNYYHPTFLYESLWNIVGIVFVLIIRRMKFIRSGDLLAFYLIWYSIGRFMIEAMRTDSLYVWGTGLRTAQITSIAMILAGIILIIFNHIIIKRKHYTKSLEENSVQS